MPNALMPQLETNNLVPDIGSIENQSLKNQLLKETIANQPARREIADQALSLKEAQLQIMELAQKVKADALTSKMNEIEQVYPGPGGRLLKIKGSKDALLKIGNVVGNPYYADQIDQDTLPWIRSQGVSIEPWESKEWKPQTQQEALAYEQAKAGAKPKDVETWVTPSGQTINLPKGEMPPSGSVPFKGKGLDIQFDESGKPIRITQGEVGPAMSKPTQTKIETKIIDGKEQLARMHAIALEFKPEYQEIGTRLSNAWTGLKASFGKNVDPEAAKAMTEYDKFRRKAIENINMYIKEITGAQMSELEANRIRLAQPDPGERWWQGDNPITFKAKMDDVIKMTRAAVARYEYYRQKGLGDNQIKAIINSGTGIDLEELASRME